MRVLITGGSGFLGSGLAARLLASGIGPAGAPRGRVDELVLLDIVKPQSALLEDPRVIPIVAPIDQALPDVPDVDVIFHLAGVVSGAAERDFDLGLHVNVDGARALLERARAHRIPPVLVFTSSLAVFSTPPHAADVFVVDDDTLPRPESSYGTQKFIVEQLVADYTRKGYVRGRSVRLMTVSVRPGKPNAAASSFLSGIIREPLAGQPAVCPVAPDTPVALSSPGHTLDGILAAAQTAPDVWEGRTAMNLPALTTTPADMIAALERAAGRTCAGLVDWQRDPAIDAIVSTWPARFDARRARRLGLTPPATYDEAIDEYRRAAGLTSATTAREWQPSSLLRDGRSSS